MTVTLIGMPGSGKSTVGNLLANKLACDFVDTDSIIEARTGQRLRDFLTQKGEAQLRTMEERVILELTPDKDIVVATGGSAI